MAGFTNRGKYLIVRDFFQNQDTPANFLMHLVTSASAPTADTNVLGDLTQINTGNGYTGGYTLTKNTTDFDAPTESDASDYGSVQIKDVVWTATGGSIPASGNPARYAVLCAPSGDVVAYFDLGADRTVSVGQTLTLQNCELRLTEA